MNRVNQFSTHNAAQLEPSTTEPCIEELRSISNIILDALIRVGREITRHTAIAERERDSAKIDRLLRAKDQVHRLRKELSDASF